MKFYLKLLQFREFIGVWVSHCQPVPALYAGPLHAGAQLRRRSYHRSGVTQVQLEYRLDRGVCRAARGPPLDRRLHGVVETGRERKAGASSGARLVDNDHGLLCL